MKRILIVLLSLSFILPAYAAKSPRGIRNKTFENSLR